MTEVNPEFAEVAAVGTDPARLQRVIRIAAADRPGFAARWRDARRKGLTPFESVTAATSCDVLDNHPGDVAGRTWARLGVRVCLAGDPAMPGRLDCHEVTPPWLAIRGAPPEASPGAEPAPTDPIANHHDVVGDGPTVAIVGSRRATGYGTGVAAWLAEAASTAGIRVISGGAVGIDAAAHGGALGAVGATTVVLGCGHDVAYPRPHAHAGGLFERIVAAGGTIVSELLPHEEPRPHHVRARNRFVAGLADAVVVVEGRANSGSLITANWAADLGIPVLAVPGDVRAAGSQASHQLLRDGAGICTGPADLLATALADVTHHGLPLGSTREPGVEPAAAASGLPPVLHDVLAKAWPRPVAMARLVDATGLSVAVVMAGLTRAQVAGTVTRDIDGVRLCRKPAG